MSRQFTEGTVHKTYLALVRGDSRSFRSDSGRIEQPIRYRDGYFDGLGGDGEPSVTEWELLADSVSGILLRHGVAQTLAAQPIAPLSLVRLRLLTGHKHQLRIHLAKSLRGEWSTMCLPRARPLITYHCSTHSGGRTVFA